MANTYFDFKQFRVEQERCAMKVSTEACILGASVPLGKPTRILDIGTGTGLLALMLAQRYHGEIDAVEIDADAALQAQHNVGNSPWKARINIFQENIFLFAKRQKHPYDLIICNPPFYRKSLPPTDQNANRAKHESDVFDQRRLANALKELLSVGGAAYVLYPEREARDFQSEVEKCGLKISRHLIIRNQPDGPIFRLVLKLSAAACDDEPGELAIRDGEKYTKAFDALLESYTL